MTEYILHLDENKMYDNVVCVEGINWYIGDFTMVIDGTTEGGFVLQQMKDIKYVPNTYIADLSICNDSNIVHMYDIMITDKCNLSNIRPLLLPIR